METTMRCVVAVLLLVLSVVDANAQWFNRSKPSHCPERRWCGCFLASYLGIDNKELWRATKWTSMGKRVSKPVRGAVAVYPHHVGVITDVPGPGQIVLLSGNDGGQVRERARSTKGVIAYVVLR